MRCVEERRQERIDALEIIPQMRESQPEWHTVDFLVQCWGATQYRYVDEIKGGARRMMTMLSYGARKTEFTRKALTHGKGGNILRKFPTVWFMGRITGYWEKTAVPKLEGSAPREACEMILNSPKTAQELLSITTIPPEKTLAHPVCRCHRMR